VLTTYNDTQPIAAHHPLLEFEADQLSGTTGCNHYGGTYQIDENSINFDGVYSTEMACLEPDGLMEQERIYQELLRAVDRFELNESVLSFYAKSKLNQMNQYQSKIPPNLRHRLLLIQLHRQPLRRFLRLRKGGTPIKIQ
jgi:hypothetical protein